ncbi:hypothetical protein BT96DRAFT_1002883 [Gymnopus androsaceus JB14]|uniref:Uncharacterized protein n=1 Tax=Gymnopus androsaceus JB14 TaxID=1447944 RepID=A0A6A4GWL6_9AGAR|nr:hypothetical protein BT96DRAFT_1002883 [Gymnopus androsaceus JB14]
MITTTEFPHAIMNYHKPHSGYSILLDRIQSFFIPNDEETHLTKLLFVVHSPPFHWIACSIDFLSGLVQFSREFVVRNNLECGQQADSFSCAITAVNSVEHEVFGVELWAPEAARELRMKTFLKLLGREISSSFSYEPLLSNHNPSSTSNPLIIISSQKLSPVKKQSGKCSAETSLSPEEKPFKKRNVDVPSQDHPFFATIPQKPKGFIPSSPSGKPKGFLPSSPSGKSKSMMTSAKVKKGKAEQDGDARVKASSPSLTLTEKDATVAFLKETIKESGGGQRASATAGRTLRRLATAGVLEVSTKKWNNFSRKISDIGGDSKLDLHDPNGVFCIDCQTRLAMKETYNTSRWKEHLNKCKPKHKARLLTDFESFEPLDAAQAAHAPPPPCIIRQPCPGITKYFEPRIEQYLKDVESDGGRSKSVGYFSTQLFNRDYPSLSKPEQEQVRMAVAQGHAWRNHFEKDIEVVFACGKAPCERFVEFQEGFKNIVKPYTPCSNCILVHHSADFQKALKKKQADSKTKKFIPDTHHQQNLYDVGSA